MPRRSSTVMFAWTAVCLFVCSTKCAHAYIDPGTGSYVLQVLVAGVLAAAFVAKSTFRSLRESVVRLFKRRS